MRYPVVLFDVGETLVGPRRSFGAIYADVLRRFGLEIDEGVVERALRATWRVFDAQIPPGVDRYRHFPGGEQEYWLRFATETLARLGDGAVSNVIAAEALKLLRDAFLDPASWRIYEDVPESLAALREQGTRLAVVSNWDSRLPAILEMLGLARNFDAVVVSHLEGVEKPDPRLFEIALRRLGVSREHALHVGDRPELDWEGARAAGIDGVIVNRGGRELDGIPTVRDLRGLPRIARHGLERRSGTGSR